jgi:DNA-binding protein HU-beta
MHKTELVRQVSLETRLAQRIAADVLDATLAEVTRTLARKGTVTLPGFGTFYTRERGKAEVMDLRTKEPITVPAMHVAGFRASEELKKAVRRSKKA